MLSLWQCSTVCGDLTIAAVRLGYSAARQHHIWAGMAEQVMRAICALLRFQHDVQEATIFQ